MLEPPFIMSSLERKIMTFHDGGSHAKRSLMINTVHYFVKLLERQISIKMQVKVLRCSVWLALKRYIDGG